MVGEGAHAVGANCEQDPPHMLEVIRQMRRAVDVPLAAQPAAFRVTPELPCFTKRPQFPDDMETIQSPRGDFLSLGRAARSEGIRYLGGCCGANAAYVRALAAGVRAARAG
jgi:methionine synthase I (cobalamin-dependent)